VPFFTESIGEYELTDEARDIYQFFGTKKVDEISESTKNEKVDGKFWFFWVLKNFLP
jgi:hypothetical protein